MKRKKLTGTKIPPFTYDTPTKAENDFYTLCAGETPLVMVFLSNFGHPISRAYLTAYLQSISVLTKGRLACVVRSNPQVIADAFGVFEPPFTILCDADGVLYDYFEIAETTSFFDWTLAARRIIKEAKQAGYQHDKKVALLLPLTLVVGREGQVLYAHRARSLTDLPEDCEAIQRVCAHLNLPEPAQDAPGEVLEDPQTAQTLLAENPQSEQPQSEQPQSEQPPKQEMQAEALRHTPAAARSNTAELEEAFANLPKM